MKKVDIAKMDMENLREYKKEIDDELKLIQKRENEIIQEKRRLEIEENIKFIDFLKANSEVIKKIIPKNHDRTSCSDENRHNSYFEGSYPRCTRCMLLELLDDNYWDETHKIEFEVRIREI